MCFLNVYFSSCCDVIGLCFSMMCVDGFLDLKGLSEEEVRAAAACAGEEVTIRNRFSEMNAPRDNSSNK